MSRKSDLPFGSEFSPSQIELVRVPNLIAVPNTESNRRFSERDSRAPHGRPSRSPLRAVRRASVWTAGMTTEPLIEVGALVVVLDAQPARAGGFEDGSPEPAGGEVRRGAADAGTAHQSRPRRPGTTHQPPD